MQTTEDPSIASIIGNSPQIIDLKQAVLKIAPRNTTVLITGETGTGKELFAQALHQGSLRRFKPFVRVNCAAIPETLLESELFGYADGSFTGGKKGGYLGKFAIADGGTVFLDEMAELSFPLQAKLLRFLQEHEIQRIGESMPRRVNVRVVAATNANLAQLVKYKKFRSDLYYRLNVVTLEIPPLRSRREDIPLLSQTFLKQLNVEYDYRIYRLNPSVRNIFEVYPWPGNVRELYNVLETAFNLYDEGTELRVEHLPQYLRDWHTEQTQAEIFVDKNVDSKEPAVGTEETTKQDQISILHQDNITKENNFSSKMLPEGRNDKDKVKNEVKEEELQDLMHYMNMLGQFPLAKIMDDFEANILRYLLSRETNRSHVAEMLGISRPALYKKMHRYFLQ